MKGWKLGLGVPKGSSFGMYPAMEIALHLNRAHAVQDAVEPACGGAFRNFDGGTNLRPSL
jgi:hypothetical protein